MGRREGSGGRGGEEGGREWRERGGGKERREGGEVRWCVGYQGNTDLNTFKGDLSCFNLAGCEGARGGGLGIRGPPEERGEEGGVRAHRRNLLLEQ